MTLDNLLTGNVAKVTYHIVSLNLIWK